ncbi:NmrA family NAD(P)-binding protein [Hymenobacter metallicola]|uniref:NAD-dependent epimerase/dehydratase family protein n=1 Tax=Hymenobacter metallicola TaxID=2563114 RepID=A0A4Z0QKH4_9BACT|nr:NmrA family NAD(P)-binding protein [Hymenobacter metallicola]TGE29222.1 NAD-dependent epimerase/dehydratase family protein [Hymenobacter metallicola]
MNSPSTQPTAASAPSPTASTATIVLAGATGALGLLIAHHLRQRGATVRALVRPGASAKAEAASLRLQGVELVEVDYANLAQLTQACTGADCVVSALSGLREVIVDAQTRLLEAAVAAGVPRIIPSDFSADFTQLPEGSNRNFDLRREFQRRLDQAPIRATSILNGMFTELLKGQAPVILTGPRRVVYWGDADQPLDFTTMVNTAEYTAAAALDPTTPRYLCVAGEVASIRGLQAEAEAATGHKFKLLRVGGLGVLGTLIKATKALMPANDEIFPPWQGMQYLHNMLSGQAKLRTLDNARYPEIRWTQVREVLATKS